jgi:hypothetical protein
MPYIHQGKQNEFVFAFIAVICLVVMALASVDHLTNDEKKQEKEAQFEWVATVALAAKRAAESNTSLDGKRKKRAYIKWDHERAQLCVYRDYWGHPNPLFSDKMFERTFRVTRSTADMLLQRVCVTNSFFMQKTDALGKTGICPKVKLLMALQLLAYGCSPTTFQAYYQMGVTTAQLCLKNFCKSLVQDLELRSTYLREMTRADARRVSAMHHMQHGVAGMVGSLDCMHVGWKNCPVAWQGQEHGKEGFPTIVLEAVSDYNLWFWHVSFGWAGTLNDINIWEKSPLLEAFIDGTWRDNVDFPFTVANKEFNHLWLTTDGIYPELACFVKTVQEPINDKAKGYSRWQEATRKDIERAFGVVQRKFQILIRKFEQWYVNDISDIVLACIMLHNNDGCPQNVYW